MTYSSFKRVSFAPLSLSLPVLVGILVNASIYFAIYSVNEKAEAEGFAVSPMNAQTMPLLKATHSVHQNSAKGGGDIIVEDGSLVSPNDVSERDDAENGKTSNGEISLYLVREGDTLSQIADMFEVSAKTILWANDLKSAGLIKPGSSLVILPITGVRHIVKKGDTIASIAKKYSGDVDDILSYNQLTSGSELTVGDTVMIPDGTITVPTPARSATGKAGGSAVASGGALSNPLPGGVKTQGIHGYNGVDLSGVPVGSSVVAAAAGDVIVAKGSGWNGGYGAYIVIKHPNGTQTLYAHLSSVSVSVGQYVGKGAVIGGMGNSGRSTGPHLHFEVRGSRNPF